MNTMCIDYSSDSLIKLIKDLIQNKSTELMKEYPNVVGVGIGEKFLPSINRKIPCLTYFVNEHYKFDNVNTEKAIPDYKYGVPTNIIEVGTIVSQ